MPVGGPDRNPVDASVPAPPEEILGAIAGLRRVITVSHVVPDADALGSMYAVAAALDGGGRHVAVSLPEGSLSQRLRFLTELAAIPIATPADFESADGFIVLDTAKASRCNVGAALKDSDWSAGRPVVNIDHHDTNTRFGAVNWIVGGASSTCELAYYMLKVLGRPITPQVASLLYAGIQTDTLGFSLPSTTPSALLAAADLVALGADVGTLGERLGRSLAPSEFALLRVIYGNTRVLADGRLAYSYASFEEIQAAGCTAADIDDQINVPRSLDGVELALLFTEGRQGKTRINFRGSGNVTVTELAAAFGGGGHAQASGAVLDCGLQQAIDQVIPSAIANLQKFPGV